jgi:hypothetical protein
MQPIVIVFIVLLLPFGRISSTSSNNRKRGGKKSSAPTNRKQRRSPNIVIQKAPVSAGIAGTIVGDDKYESDVLADGESTTLKTNSTIPVACSLTDLTCIQRKYSIEYIFPTPLMYHTLVIDKKTFDYNQDIKRIMLDLEEENDGCKFNLHGGYRSKDGFLDRPEQSIRWLREQIEHRIRLMLSLSGAADTPFFIDGWGAVLRGNHGQSVHVHPQSMYVREEIALLL